MPSSQTEREYRWAVTVKRNDGPPRPPYVRQVDTAGPNPDCAAKKALDLIQEDSPGNDLWQANKLSIDVERVR